MAFPALAAPIIGAWIRHLTTMLAITASVWGASKYVESQLEDTESNMSQNLAAAKKSAFGVGVIFLAIILTSLYMRKK